MTSISREVARERQAKGKARARARAFPTPLTALPLASTISRGSNRLSCNGDLARRLLFSKLTSELTVSRDLKIRRRRRQRESQKSNRCNNQNNNFARASRFFVHFFAVAARLRRENPYFHVLKRKCTSDDEISSLSLSESGYGPWEFNFRRVDLYI